MGTQQRCGWCLGNALYEEYHDREWGVPEHREQRLFEFLVLEGAQAGLSWITVLKKRECYRRVMNEFDPIAISGWGEDKNCRIDAGSRNYPQPPETGVYREKCKGVSADTGFVWWL